MGIFSTIFHSEIEDSPSWISTSTTIKVSAILLASSALLFGLAAVIKPVAPIIEEILDEEPNEVRRTVTH